MPAGVSGGGNPHVRDPASPGRALPDESFFTDDGFHPNDKGQTAIAAVFDAALASAGYPTALASRRRR